MTDPTATPDPVPAPPTPRPGLLRPAALWLVPLTILVLLALVPLALEPWLEGRVRAAVALAGLELAPETSIDISVLGGRITLGRLDLRERVDGQPRSLFTADRAELDADVLACLAGDIVFDSIILEGASGDLRRRGDGTVPLATPPPAERGGTDWGKLDWWGLLRQAYAWQQQRDAAADQAPTTTPAPPRQQSAPDWSGARTYEPAPGPAGPPTRVLIRKLSLSGREFLLPDDTPFAITAFSASGHDLGWGRREAGTSWALDLQATTRAAGSLDLGLGSGRLRLVARQLPLSALAHPALAGAAFARYGASGTADLTLDGQWTRQLTGTIQAQVAGLRLDPTSPTPREEQVAQILNRLGGRPLTWTMTLGGTPQDPEITDDGLAALAKGQLAEAAKQAAIEEGTKRLEEALQKNPKAQELQKNPAVKKATDKATDLLKGLGK